MTSLLLRRALYQRTFWRCRRCWGRAQASLMRDGFDCIDCGRFVGGQEIMATRGRARRDMGMVV